MSTRVLSGLLGVLLFGTVSGEEPRAADELPVKNEVAGVTPVWKEVAPSVPYSRGGHEMVYDSVRERVLLYGGSRKTNTWEWDGQQWELVDNSGISLNYTNGPYAMTFDDSRGVAIAVTGIDQFETWEWDGEEWEMVHTGGPTVSSSLEMAYDDARQRTVLFEGDNESDKNNTWEWDGEQWELVSTTGPPPRRGHTMAYDSTRERIVLFGGGDHGLDLDDTWEWDGEQWEQIGDTFRFNSVNIAMAYDEERERMVMLQGTTIREWNGENWEKMPIEGPLRSTVDSIAYDHARQKIVGFGAQSIGNPQMRVTWTWDGENWEAVGPRVPLARKAHAMAYDSARERAVLFGGRNEDQLRKTWEWNGKRWELMAIDGPSAREAHAMAYDSRREKVVLFGGGDDSGLVQDTWEWDGDQWEQVDNSGPSPRFHHTMAYDPSRQRVVLAGGRDSSGSFEDTWEWDGKDWDLATTSSTPLNLDGMVYDSSRQRIVALEAWEGITWEWNGAVWRQVNSTPSLKRGRSAMAYDKDRKRLVLFGGVRSNRIGFMHQDTLEWDGENWELISTSGPYRRSNHAMVYDSARQQIVLFSGDMERQKADTWLYGIPSTKFHFEDSAEDWQFFNPDEFSEVTGDYNGESQSLSQESSDNSNAFAYWQSPIIDVFEPWQTLMATPGYTIFGGSGDKNLYTGRFLVSSDDTERLAPDTRMRTSSDDFHRSDVVAINSREGGEISPRTPPQLYQHFFLLPLGAEGLRLNWDILNFNEENDPGVRLELHSAEISATSEQDFGTPFPLAGFSFEDRRTHGFTPRTGPPLREPDLFAPTVQGLLIRGVLDNSHSRNGGRLPSTTFGYWGKETDVTLTGDRLYRLEWTIETDGVTTSTMQKNIPVFRLRANETSLQSASFAHFESRGDEERLPRDGEPKTYRTYFHAPPELDGEKMILSFDYLYSEQSDDDPTIGLILRRLEIQEIVPD